VGACNKESQINEDQLGDEVSVMRRELGAARDALHAAREERASGESEVTALADPHVCREWVSGLCRGTSLIRKHRPLEDYRRALGICLR